MTRVWGPPSRCAACGRYGSTAESVEPSKCECGADLPVRSFIEPMPVICGTALGSIDRITQLRALGARARITVSEAGDELEVSIALDVAESTSLPLPVHLGVVLLPEGAPFPGELSGGVELAAGSSATCRFPRVGWGAGSRGSVYLRFADALYERAVVVERDARP